MTLTKYLISISKKSKYYRISDTCRKAGTAPPTGISFILNCGNQEEAVNINSLKNERRESKYKSLKKNKYKLVIINAINKTTASSFNHTRI